MSINFEKCFWRIVPKIDLRRLQISKHTEHFKKFSLRVLHTGQGHLYMNDTQTFVIKIYWKKVQTRWDVKDSKKDIISPSAETIFYWFSFYSVVFMALIIFFPFMWYTHPVKLSSKYLKKLQQQENTAHKSFYGIFFN